MPSEIEALTTRVARLERANRRLKFLGVGVILAFGALALTSFAAKPRTIEAEKIVIRDSHNRARITIGTPEFAGAAIESRPDAPTVWLTDEKGSDRTILTADGLYFANEHAKPLVELISGPNGPVLRFHNSDGGILWSTP